MEHFLKGFAIGFAVAAPVGPVGLLCIRRAILDGRLAGFVTGLGAATADAIFGLIAALGLTSVTTFLTSHATGFQLVGGLCLLAIGLATMRSRPPVRESGSVHAHNLTAAYASTIAITLTNPMTIAGFIGIFTGFGVGLGTTGAAQVSWLVFGVFLGSAAWWLLLSGCASWFGKRIPDNGLHAINVGAGLAIAFFGVWQLARFALKLS
ncbi:MAG TPA: LysE family transporter [Opitutaceae bacterium]|jgi:threonine/homoserine/homoserine lactone efflux protein|nr:LysE family transporter [Opitutaceae bacterium]